MDIWQKTRNKSSRFYRNKDEKELCPGEKWEVWVLPGLYDPRQGTSPLDRGFLILKRKAWDQVLS